MLIRSKTAINLGDIGPTNGTLQRRTKSVHKMHNTTTRMVDALRTTLETMPLMKSVRYHGPGDIRVEEISEPFCGREEVKVYSRPPRLLVLVSARC